MTLFSWLCATITHCSLYSHSLSGELRLLHIGLRLCETRFILLQLIAVDIVSVCLSGYGSLAEQQQQQQQVTFMQKLQAERRRRLLDYQQRKRLEAGNCLCYHWHLMKDRSDVCEKLASMPGFYVLPPTK